MPINPASMDQMPPVTKAKGVNLESMDPLEPNAMARRTINTTTNVRIILMNALVTVDIGITSLGKYIFLTMLDSRIIHVEPS